ncbi:MAG: DUF294 nucleotidyltransferase-like domain-containing protein [Bacteroidales bacterium]
MPDNNLHRFFISIVLPSILAIGFFILLIFLVILPAFEKNIMDGKKEMISQLTNTAWSLLDEYHQEVVEQTLPEDSAKLLAVKRIEQVRYGDENKDYFWVIDRQPMMIMHPYRRELVGTGLSDYQDPEGKLLFMEAIETVEKQGEGFINYMWQWQDDSTRIVPKLSYVKGFEPWGWIVGTGIYLEDVREEIRVLKNKLLRITLLFTLLIGIILAFIIRQSLGMERGRKNAEQKLRFSRQKYKSLVEASTEATLMFLRGDLIFSNITFGTVSGYNPSELRNMHFEDLFRLTWEELTGMFTNAKKSVSLETMLECNTGTEKEVVISASMIPYADETGFVVLVKEVGSKQQMDKAFRQLSDELQTALLLMDQPIKPLAQAVKKCPSATTIREVAHLMTRKGRNIIFMTQQDEIVGVITSNDLRNRVLSANIDPGRPVVEVMTSPVVTISENALLHDALLELKLKKISHLAMVDPKGEIVGVFGREQLTEMPINSISFMVWEIANAENTEQLAAIYKRLPVLVRALTESGAKSHSITRTITSVADAMHKRVIELGMEELGSAPCGFAFMVMGSEGRGEQTLATDQDNAIVIEETKKQGVEDYFLALGARVNRDLHAIGYHYCKGEIMARNPKWTVKLAVWKKYFSDWINHGNPQDVLEAGIFFDFRFIYGDRSLVDGLRKYVHEVSANKSVFFYQMAMAVLNFKPPLNIFGNIVGKVSGADELNIDIKKVMLPVIAFIRLYAIREKLIVTGSMERLERLADLKVIDNESFEELTETFELLMHLRLRFQAINIFSGEIPGNLVNLNALTRMEISILKKVFSGIGNLQTKTGFDFKG